MATIKVSVSIEDDFLEQIARITKDLEEIGMIVEQTLSSIGIISGSIDSELIGQCSHIEGIKYVEPEKSYQLPPPDSESSINPRTP
jgi:hypothetical protein